VATEAEAFKTLKSAEVEDKFEIDPATISTPAPTTDTGDGSSLGGFSWYGNSGDNAAKSVGRAGRTIGWLIFSCCVIGICGGALYFFWIVPNQNSGRGGQLPGQADRCPTCRAKIQFCTCGANAQRAAGVNYAPVAAVPYGSAGGGVPQDRVAELEQQVASLQAAAAGGGTVPGYAVQDPSL
jgi:hypothetical protein